jgi:glyoxylase I family protein
MEGQDMRPKIGGFATLLQVFDMPASLAFYRDVLGFEVSSLVPDDDRCDWVMLTLHGSELMLNTAYEAGERPPAPDSARIAAHADVILYFDCEDVDAAYAYLRARNVAANAPTVAHYGMKQVYLKDPDGYAICLQHPAG